MSLSRKLKRHHGGQAAQLSQATQQLQELNKFLTGLPEVFQRVHDMGQVLDAMLSDMEALSKEQEYNRYLMQRMGLTPAQEAQYRADWEATKGTSECQPES